MKLFRTTTSIPSAPRSSTDQQGHSGGVKTEVKEETIPKRTLKREPPKADSTYTKIVSKLSQPSNKASKTAASGLPPGMGSDITALAESVKQYNDGRASKRSQGQVRKKPASAEAKPKQEEMESEGGACQRDQSRERRRSTPEVGSSAGASSSSAVERPRVRSILDGDEDSQLKKTQSGILSPQKKNDGLN